MSSGTRTPILARFNSKWTQEPFSGCWIWTDVLTGAGYGMLSLGSKADGQSLAHRLSWELHRGEIPSGLFVCHKCDVRCCVNPDHLFLGRSRDNLRDCVNKGRHHARCGEAHPDAILSEQNVREIRYKLSTGERKVNLMKQFRVSRGAIDGIALGKSWKHVK